MTEAENPRALCVLVLPRQAANLNVSTKPICCRDMVGEIYTDGTLHLEREEVLMKCQVCWPKFSPL